MGIVSPLTAEGRSWGPRMAPRAAQRPPAPEVQGWGFSADSLAQAPRPSVAPVAGLRSLVRPRLGSAASQFMRHDDSKLTAIVKRNHRG